MLHIILLDCALELVPSEISSLKPIQQQAQRRGKKPVHIMLDQNYHGHAMLKLENHERRGRPDIPYLCLMTLLESPLCKEGLLTIHLHLQDGRVIEVNHETRLPRNYDRFIGLFEQLLLEGKVPPEGASLLRVVSMSLPQLIAKLKAENSKHMAFLAVESGTKTSLEQLHALFPSDPEQSIIIGIGAYPHGDIDSEVNSLFDGMLELDPEVMMAWHVCAEILWTYSHRVGVIGRRYARFV